ncbi:hypothetical protein HHK36_029314 [Tetracentron sinense]|uniref:Uncharacterized protein n=1 Tax=Tetracentron sinense TaxID=13715 RepID=A0A834YGK4_TETSI|nr:hypothetical protein HHK36_029314 [Tetracentron sinense]
MHLRLIHNTNSGFQMGRSSSRGPAALGHNAVFALHDGESSGSYLATVLKSAKQRAVGLKWHQFDSKQPRQTKGEKLLSSPTPPLSIVSAKSVSASPDIEAEELPLSIQIADEQLDEAATVHGSMSSHVLPSKSENYDEFKADREAKLEEWLEGSRT